MLDFLCLYVSLLIKSGNHFPERELNIEKIHFNTKMALFYCQKYLALNSNGN